MRQNQITCLKIFFVAISFFAFNNSCRAGTFASDTSKIKRERNYIRPCFYLNHYSTPQRPSKLKKQYRFAQNNIGFYIPIYTKSWYNKDSVGLSNISILGVTDMIQYKPELDFINESYKIGRLSAGPRLFYMDGKKNVFYFTFMPFVSQEFKTLKNPAARFTTAFIYNRTVSRNFSYRFGFARTYTFGRALLLPIIGFRFGPVDKLHFNIQFPRNMSIDFPLGKSVWTSIFSRSMGGIYNVVTQDTILAKKGSNAKLQRFELLNGVQFSFRTGNHVSFYLSTGFTTRRYVNYTFNESDNSYVDQDIKFKKIPNSLFISFGVAVRFGQAKKIYNSSTMYDMFDINSLNKAGFNESGNPDNDVPVNSGMYKAAKLKNLQYKDVEDLVTDDY